MGLHLCSFQMDQRGDEFLLMKFKGGLFNRKLTANQGYLIGILMTEPWGNEESDEFCSITKIF